MAFLRHDEQADEEFYDDRSEAGDDVEKGKIHFPKERLFGREEELDKLMRHFDSCQCPVYDGGESSTLISSSSTPSHGPLSQVVLLKGFSGCGKTALVEGFVRRLEQESRPFYFACGKHGKHVETEPFSEINHALNGLLKDLTNTSYDFIDRIRLETRKAGLMSGDASHQLFAVLPCLHGILLDQTADARNSISNKRFDTCQLSYVFSSFMNILSRVVSHETIILFLDDLQWADTSSLELLNEILDHSTPLNLFFIGGYRSNEVDLEHASLKHIDNLAEMTRVLHVEVSNLSQAHIAQFLAETLDEDLDRVEHLARILFTRTLGNILFCRQALEELVRNNMLYYDIVLFRWEFNLDGVNLDNLLSKDIVALIQSRIRSLAPRTQRVLSVASFIRSIIDPTTLLHCLIADGCCMTREVLDSILRELVNQGLVEVSEKGVFRFSHDRVQEAAYECVPGGEARFRLQRTIATVLLDIHNLAGSGGHREEWMAFVAADYFISVPNNILTIEETKLVRLFLEVAQASASKGAYKKAVGFLRSAVDVLCHRPNVWSLHYKLCLETYNQLIVAEFALGNMHEARQAIDVVMWNGSSLKDTRIAYHTAVDWTIRHNSGDFAKGAAESIRLLKDYDIYIPLKPSKSDILLEYMRMKVALKGQGISAIANLPLAKDDSLMRLLFQLCHILALGKLHDLNTYVTMKAIRISLRLGLTKCLPEILMTYTAPLRIAGRLNVAYSYATLVNDMNRRFPSERGLADAKQQLILFAGILPLKNRFSESIDALSSSYRVALSCGDVDNALNAAMNIPMHYFAAALPLNAMLEPKLMLYESKSQQLHRPGFTAVFQCCRQFLYNLTKTTPNPTLLRGTVMDEDEVLSNMEGNMKRMTTRDFGIFRITLACIFNDEHCMEEMMERLESYPLFDMPVARQHLRLTFQGMAAFILARRTGNRNYGKVGRSIQSEIRKLDVIGSTNARPVWKCLKAVRKHRRKTYDQAIVVCSSAKMVHLEAIMNEQCGMMMMEDKDSPLVAHEYLARAMWLYQDWGARGKVEEMRSRYALLPTSRPERTDKTSMSALFQCANESIPYSRDPFRTSYFSSKPAESNEESWRV